MPIKVKFNLNQCSLELDAQIEILKVICSIEILFLLYSSMLYSDFAAAAVLISFGVIIGTTSPLQLMVMALIEIVLFFINEVIGRKYLKVR